jgi:ankyrin repeat protein
VFNTHRETFKPALIHFAVNNGSLEELQSLTTQGIDLNYRMHGNTPLILAILKEEYALAECLIKAGARVDIPQVGKWARQPIHLAAELGKLSLLKQLVKHGASIHAADATFRTPLHCAAFRCHKDCVEYLLDKGAHVNIKDDCGRTPLFRAVEGCDTSIVDMLAEAGGVINTRDKFNWTPLCHSVVCADYNMIEHLIDNYTIDVDAQTSDMSTALHLAISRTRRDRMDILTETGENLPMRAVLAPTDAIRRALKVQNPCSEYTVKLLIDYGCNVNLQNHNGENAFRLATEYASKDLILFLISAGVDVGREESWLKEQALQSLCFHLEFLPYLRSLSEIKVRSLRDICRLAIRHYLRPFISCKINMLPLPSSLKDYLYASEDNVPQLSQ